VNGERRLNQVCKSRENNPLKEMINNTVSLTVKLPGNPPEALE